MSKAVLGGNTFPQWYFGPYGSVGRACEYMGKHELNILMLDAVLTVVVSEFVSCFNFCSSSGLVEEWCLKAGRGVSTIIMPQP